MTQQTKLSTVVLSSHVRAHVRLGYFTCDPGRSNILDASIFDDLDSWALYVVVFKIYLCIFYLLICFLPYFHNWKGRLRRRGKDLQSTGSPPYWTQWQKLS